MAVVPTDDRLFRAAFEGTRDGLVLIDDDGTCTEANGAVGTLTGRSEDVVVGRSVAEIVRPGTDFEAALDDALASGTASGRFSVARDGDSRPVDFAVTADVSTGTHLLAIRAVEDDGADLRRLSALLTSVFETATVGVVIADADGAVTGLNARGRAMLGLGRVAAADGPVEPPEWRAVDAGFSPASSGSSPLETVLETGAAVFGVERGIERPDGETVWVSVDAAPLCRGEAVDGAVAVVSDATDDVEYRRLLKRQNERLEEYSATVSHDLRSPLSVASGWLDIAIDKASTEPLGRIDEALERMEELIGGLRAIGRHGQLVEGFSELDLGELAGIALSEIGEGDRPLVIEDDLGAIRGDRDRVLELFRHLFRNSVEHGSTGSRTASDDSVEHGSMGNRPQADDSVEHGRSDATIRVGPIEDGFYVADDGPGIPEGDRESVLEFGYSTADEGTGVGLAAVKAIADAHGWELVLTDAEGGGARVEFRQRWHPQQQRTRRSGGFL